MVENTYTFSVAACEYLQRSTVSRFTQDPQGDRLSHRSLRRLHCNDSNPGKGSYGLMLTSAHTTVIRERMWLLDRNEFIMGS
jgi:hypothetical protein